MAVMVLANHNRLRGCFTPASAWPDMIILKHDGTWAGEAKWACRVLDEHGLIRAYEDKPIAGDGINHRAYPYRFVLTVEGRACLRGALEVEGDFDPAAVLLDVDFDPVVNI